MKRVDSGMRSTSVIQVRSFKFSKGRGFICWITEKVSHKWSEKETSSTGGETRYQGVPKVGGVPVKSLIIWLGFFSPWTMEKVKASIGSSPFFL